MNEVQVESITLYEDKLWLGQILITSDGMFAAVSDYGNFSFCWRSYGSKDQSLTSFKQFLLRLDKDYFAGKMVLGLMYILTRNKKVDRAAEVFAEHVLPALQEELKKQLSTTEKDEKTN